MALSTEQKVILNRAKQLGVAGEQTVEERRDDKVYCYSSLYHDLGNAFHTNEHPAIPFEEFHDMFLRWLVIHGLY